MTRNLTHVQSPSYPGNYLPDTSATCTYTFTKVNTRVCQVRLDFVEFVLGPPISTNVVSSAGNNLSAKLYNHGEGPSWLKLERWFKDGRGG